MFKVNREALARELAVLQFASERKGTIPILAFTLIQVTDGIAKLTATDTEITIATQVEAEGDPYSGCIPIKQLSSLVKLLDGETVQFTEKSNQRIEIKAGTSKHLLATFPADQFPEVENIDGEAVSIPASSLATMLRRVAFCAGKEGEGLQYVFQCLCFEIANKTLTVVATNSKQLGAMSIPITSEIIISALIPSRSVSALEKLCTVEGDVLFTASLNRAQFECNGRILATQLTVGAFPAWRMVVPELLEHQTIIDSDGLLASIKRACVTTREAKLIRHPLALSFSKKELLVTSQSEEGESTDTVPIDCTSLNGSDIAIRVNGEHFINFIARTEGQVTCAFSDDKRLIQLGIEGDDSYKYITMALR